MKKIHAFLVFASTAAMGTVAYAQKLPAPGPEFGEGSIGLLALGVSAVAYAVYKSKNKK